MVLLTRSSAVLELGRRLASQLDVHGDLLASWMAHYVAELTDAADKAPAETKAAAQEACANAVLKLWQHRTTLPSGRRPLEDLEPALRTLASLDPERTSYRYYPEVLREAKTADADQEAKQWLDLAVRVDSVARLLIRFALRSATSRAASAAAHWVKLAAQAGADESGERVIVQFVGGNEEGEADQDTQSVALREDLSRLEAFVELAASLAKDVRIQLDSEQQKEE
jgi:hypothetical protein